MPPPDHPEHNERMPAGQPWRWEGVPFYIRKGKRLRADYAEGAIGFCEAPAQLFRQAPLERQSPNGLVFRLRSFEYMALHGWIRAPRLQRNVRFLVLSAPLQQNNESDGAYKQLLRDVVRRDCSLFLHHNEIEWA